jgi:hypothetical protein
LRIDGLRPTVNATQNPELFAEIINKQEFPVAGDFVVLKGRCFLKHLARRLFQYNNGRVAEEGMTPAVI